MWTWITSSIEVEVMTERRFCRLHTDIADGLIAVIMSAAICCNLRSSAFNNDFSF
jgi:hypothetical protein